MNIICVCNQMFVGYDYNCGPTLVQVMYRLS